MTNKEIIEQINHFCVKKKSMCWGDSQCAYMLLSHSYLFVKPHKKGKKLVQNILSAIPKSTKKAIKNFYPCFLGILAFFL